LELNFMQHQREGFEPSDPLRLAQQRLVAASPETHKERGWPDDIRAALACQLETSDAHDPAA
jgi:hypothetical protein